jgi:hypothetical protein
MTQLFSRSGAVILAAGIAAAGWLIGNGFGNIRTADRYVTVKGVSEREVKADVAIWPLRMVAAGDNLSQTQAKIEKDQKTILAFLEDNGIPASATELQGLDVTDALADRYRSGQPIVNRFFINQTVMVRFDQPDVVMAASQKVSELVDAGVVLSGSGGGPGPYGSGPTFLFTGLNEIKPEMIAEATASARRSAEQFAADSKSSIRGIRRANQGVFVILPRDQAPGIMESSQLHKTVRVVSTIDYYLR